MAYKEYLENMSMILKPYNEVNFDEYWGRIQITVQDYINSVNVPKSTVNEIKEDIEILCSTLTHPYDEELWVATKSLLTNHVKQLVEKFQQDGGKFQLRLYLEIWIQFRQAMRHLDELYEFLNLIYKDFEREGIFVTKNFYTGDENRKLVGELGLELWKDNMMIFFHDKILDEIFECIHLYRTGDYVEYCSLTIIVRVIQSFIDVEIHKKDYNMMKFYQDKFEKPFIALSGEFYQKESERFLSEGNMMEYMEKVTQLREEENLLFSHLINQSSYIKLGATFDQIFISNVLPRLLEECSRVIAEERWSDIYLLYGLVKSVKGGLPAVIKQFGEYMKQPGEMLLKISAPGPEGPKSPEEFVNRIMAFHAKNYEFIEQFFHEDKEFIRVLDQTCGSVINHNSNPDRNCPSLDLLLKYCDGVLKKSSKNISESNIEDKLSKAIKIFEYIKDKDIFERMYKGLLARRLLLRKSQSLEVESSMITRIRKICGFEFTRQLDQMIKDTTLSADLTNQFNTNIINGNIELEIDFSIQVLRGFTWPIRTPIPSLALPHQLTTCIQKFEDYYKGQFSGRKLTWLHHLSQGQIHLTYLDKPYLITMPTFQMAILLLFENDQSLTGKDVQVTLQLNSDQFSKNVASLVENKLIKSNTPTILPETVLSLNLEFTNTLTKFKLGARPLKRDIPKKAKLIQGNVDSERKNHNSLYNCPDYESTKNP